MMLLIDDVTDRWNDTQQIDALDIHELGKKSVADLFIEAFSDELVNIVHTFSHCYRVYYILLLNYVTFFWIFSTKLFSKLCS